MSILFNNPLLGAAGQGGAGFTIDQSARFHDTQRLTRTFANNSGNTWTWSAWLKKTSTSISDRYIFGTVSPLLSSMVRSNSFGWTKATIANFESAKRRDPSAWYHRVDVSDGTDLKLYINGVLVQTWSSASTGINTNVEHFLGGDFASRSAAMFQGYMAQVHFIDGTAVSDTGGVIDEFGQYNDDGVWIPQDYTGTYGNNGFHLTFDSSQANGIGHDSSGNDNHWTASGFDTAASSTDYDLMQDSPTQNFATGNPLMHGRDGGTRIMSYTKANLGFLGGGPSSLPWTHPSIRVPMDVRAYAEFTNIVGAITAACGVSERRPTTDSGWGSNGCWSWALDTRVWIVKPDGSTDTVNVPGRWTGTAGDVAGVEVNTTVTPPTVTFTLNGANASTHTFNADFDPENIWIGGNFGANTVVQNFGQQPFQHQPTGTIALQTNNLPEPEIKNGSDHFQAITDTGANILTAAQTAFPDGLWWIKDRVNSNQHQLVDSVRGSNSALNCPNLTVATYSAPSGSSVAWCWNVGGAAAENTDGTLTAQVAANTDAGFSIISWTGTGVAGTVGHGLTEAPEFFINKNSVNATSGAFYAWHTGISATQYLAPGSAAAAATSSAVWNNTAPTDSVISLGTAGNGSDGPGRIMYAWHSVPGYSAFGSYTGNANADGPFVYTGFKVAWLLLKSANAIGGWMILDTTRTPNNVMSEYLSPNRDYAENTGSANHQVDLLSNGFKIRTAGGTDPRINPSGGTVIYACFAESPFGGENAPPATAR